MAFQFSTSARNAALDAIEAAVGAGAVLKIRSGAVPATVATADAGTVLATFALPSDWLAAASGGSKSKSGTWEDTSADAAGTAAHFRIYASDGTTAHIQGPVCMTSELGTGVIPADGEGYLVLQNTNLQAGQSVEVSDFTIALGGA